LKNYRKTSDGKKGGLFVGKSHDKGGIPAIVVDTGQPIEVEGGEAIINKEATKKYWKELSEINQSAGNGNPIPPPQGFSDEVSQYSNGGKISKLALAEGTKHELEHTDTIAKFKKQGVSEKEIARQIALDHLKENPNYYKVLKKLKLKKGGEIVCRSCGWSWLESENPIGENLYKCHKCNSDNKNFYKTGGAVENKKEVYDEWKTLVNMSASELKKFLETEDGKEAGLTKEKADELGIGSGRESASWILKMKAVPYSQWSDTMWSWAKRQIGFIKRMSGNKGGLYEDNGNKTRKHTSLLIWGHNPEKFNGGGKLTNNDVLKKFVNQVEAYQSNHYGTFNRDNLVESYHKLPDSIKEKIQPITTKNLFRGADGTSYKSAISFTKNQDYAKMFGTYAFPFKVVKENKGLIDTKRLGALLRKMRIANEIGDDEGEVIVIEPIFSKDIIENIEKFRFDNGGRTISQTPAPKKDRIVGSEKNAPKSSESSKSAEKIVLSEQVLESIETILREYNKDTSKKVDLNTAKAVVRRGMGAYSSSHRPTISGGKPNSRVAWGLARLKAFLYKIENGESKSGKYSQDNDLIDDLGYEHEKFAKGNKIKAENKGGNCYEMAGKMAMGIMFADKDMSYPDFKGTPYVVHAEVSGQGAISGLRYGHAWVEDDMFIYDFSNGRKIVFPKELYYALGNVITKPPKYYKYTFNEARKKMSETGHYGSWELKTESGL
jgi:rubrerythrin